MNKHTTTHTDDQLNILVNNSFHACLFDFGLSTMVGVENHIAENASFVTVDSEVSLMSFTEGGTLRWISPELLYPERFGNSDGRPTTRSDCYALGMVVYEVSVDVLVPTFTKI